MYKKLLLTICFSVILYTLTAQITISRTSVDFSVTYNEDSTYRILTFWKDQDSSIFTSVKYSITDFNKNPEVKILSDEIATINQLWNIAKDSIEFKLESFNISYPLFYSDILNNHIKAFNESPIWQNHIKQHGKKLDYGIIKNVMLEYNVYKPLNDFFKEKVYIITGFETEKHGFVTKENLQKEGYKGDEIIPMPYIVWITIQEDN